MSCARCKLGYLGQQIVPSGTQFSGTTVGGLSGNDFNPANGHFLAIDERQFIAIERSFAVGAATPGSPVTGNTIRLFQLDARNATDVSGLDSIAGVAKLQAVKKTLRLDLSQLKNDDGSALALDNIEGLSFGPQLNGQQTLILVSDNNFSGTQFTQFVALSVAAVPEPQTYALLLAGLGAAGWVVRRRCG